MQCSRGHTNQAGSQFCVVCGEQMVVMQPVQNTIAQPPPNYGYTQPPPPPFPNDPYTNNLRIATPQNGKGTAALVLGILGLFLFPVILSVLAIIFGTQGKNLADKGLATNRGAAQAGFVLGIIGLCLGVLIVLALLGG